MKILIITNSFPPDSGIATVRPAKFAKYLKKAGHDVYVIRSGNVFGKPDIGCLKELEGIKVFSYEGNEAPAERISRGEVYYANNERAKGESNHKRSTRHIPCDKAVRSIYHYFADPLRYYSEHGVKHARKIMATYRRNNDLRGFDVVISTFHDIGQRNGGRKNKQNREMQMGC